MLKCLWNHIFQCIKCGCMLLNIRHERKWPVSQLKFCKGSPHSCDGIFSNINSLLLLWKKKIQWKQRTDISARFVLPIKKYSYIYRSGVCASFMDTLGQLMVLIIILKFWNFVHRSIVDRFSLKPMKCTNQAPLIDPRNFI